MGLSGYLAVTSTGKVLPACHHFSMASGVSGTGSSSAAQAAEQQPRTVAIDRAITTRSVRAVCPIRTAILPDMQHSSFQDFMISWVDPDVNANGVW
jgi:hypothetical protein